MENVVQDVSTLQLVLSSAGSVVVLLFLVMSVRMHAFIALILVSVMAGILSGIPIDQIAGVMQKGMSGTLGFLTIVIALGAMFGKILDETGALDQIAMKLLGIFGTHRAHYAMGLIGIVCALPLFFDVAIVLLIGMMFAVARRTGRNIVKLAVPLFAGVAAAAAFLLPGPTPMLLASQMNADFGYMILIGIPAALIGMIFAGPLFGSFISRFVTIAVPEEVTTAMTKAPVAPPSFAFSVCLILFPLLLVGLKTIATHFIANESALSHFFEFIGHPFIALLAACLIVIYGLAIPRGMAKDRIMDICSAAIQPAGIILLITGAGGVFKQILVDSGVGPTLGMMFVNSGLSITFACFLLAAVVRVIQGSATVACLTTVGLIEPITESFHYNGAQLAALSICIAGGSIVLSHVNDSGFWLFGKFTGATEAQTLKTWTLMETILGTIGALVGVISFYLVS